MASTPVAVGVMVIVPVAVASGTVIVTTCSPLAAIVAEVMSAVKPPVVAIFTVISSVPGFAKVMTLVAPGFTMPKAQLSPSL